MINFELGIFDKIINRLLNWQVVVPHVKFLLHAYFRRELLELLANLLCLGADLFELLYAKLGLCPGTVVDELLVELLLGLVFLSGEVEGRRQLIKQAFVAVLFGSERADLVLQLNGKLLTLLELELI